MMKTTVKGIEVFYPECCVSQAQAIQYALRENAKNYAQKGKNIDRLKGISIDHRSDCKVGD